MASRRRIAAMTLESGSFDAVGGKLIYSVFMNLFTIFVVVMLLVMISLIPATREIPYLPLSAIIVICGSIAYLLWNVTRSAHPKMAEILSKGIMEEKK
jgi:hypothetical protein